MVDGGWWMVDGGWQVGMWYGTVYVAGMSELRR